ISIDAIFNQVLYAVKNLGEANLKDLKDDTVLETTTRHDDVYHTAKDSDTKVCQNFEQPKESPVHKIDTPLGFEISGDLFPSQIPRTRITIQRLTGQDYATPIHKNKQPGPWNRSPYLTDFRSSSVSSIILSPILDKKHHLRMLL
ncbi:hypothetical protein HAX54_049246, partial [Datura stramonium]|nr:hypothetical protein [Datura stramonium]